MDYLDRLYFAMKEKYQKEQRLKKEEKLKRKRERQREEQERLALLHDESLDFRNGIFRFSKNI